MCKEKNLKKFENDFSVTEYSVNSVFWKVNKPIIRKVTFNLPYGCWRRHQKDELNRICVIFEPTKVTYCQIPLDIDDGKTNCLIKVSYNPLLFKSNVEIGKELYSEYDFNDITLKAEKVISEHKIDNIVCDAIAASLVVNYDDGTRKVALNLCNDELSELIEWYKKLKPDCFTKAISE